MKTPSKRELIGRRIVGFELNVWHSGSGDMRQRHHDPVITLDDGSRLQFTAEETEAGEYGVSITRFTNRKGKATK